MFHFEVNTFLAAVCAKTLKAASLPLDVTACAASLPRLSQAYRASKPDHGAIAKATLLAYLEVGATLLEIKAPKKKQVDDETAVFKGDFSNAVIALGVAAILEEFPEAVAVAETYALHTEAYFKNISGRRSKKSDRIHVAKANVAAFLAMFPSPTLDDVQAFLDAGAFVKPKAPRKRATKEVAPEAEAADASEASAPEASDVETSASEVSDAAKKPKKRVPKVAGNGSASEASDADAKKKAPKKTAKPFSGEE